MSWKAIIIGTIAYIVLWFAWSVFSPSYEHQSLTSYDWFMKTFYWLIPLISGLLSGQFRGNASQNAIMHGLVVGVVIALLSVAVWSALGIMELKSMIHLSGFILLAVIGGSLSHVLQKWRAKT